MNNCWEVLGIAPTSDKCEIKRAYAKMLAKYHPEEHPEKFQEINMAYRSALNPGFFDPSYAFDETNANKAGINLEKFDPEKFFHGTPPPFPDSIFTTNTTTYEVTNAEKQAQKVLHEFAYIMGTALGSLASKNRDTPAWRKLDIFLASDFFAFSRFDYDFVFTLERFVKIFFLTAHQCTLLKKTINIYQDAYAYYYNLELNAALSGLNNHLDERIASIRKRRGVKTDDDKKLHNITWENVDTAFSPEDSPQTRIVLSCLFGILMGVQHYSYFNKNDIMLMFAGSKAFQSMKANIFFVKGLRQFLLFMPISNSRIRILKNALDKHKSKHLSQHNNEYHAALLELYSLLGRHAKAHRSDIYATIITAAIFLGVIALIVAIIVLIVRFSPSIESYEASGLSLYLNFYNL